MSLHLKIISIILICAVTPSGIPSYAITDAASDAALAPPIATKPPCQIVQKPDGSFDVVTDIGLIESQDREAVGSYGRGVPASGKAFRSRWAFVDISLLIGQMLVLTRDRDLKNPRDILIPLIRKRILARGGSGEALLEGYEIDRIEQVREDGKVTGFKLPVRRRGMPAYMLTYNLIGGDTAIRLRDGASVFVTAEKFAYERVAGEAPAEQPPPRRLTIDECKRRLSENMKELRALYPLLQKELAAGLAVLESEGVDAFEKKAYPNIKETADKIKARVDTIKKLPTVFGFSEPDIQQRLDTFLRQVGEEARADKVVIWFNQNFTYDFTYSRGFGEQDLMQFWRNMEKIYPMIKDEEDNNPTKEELARGRAALRECGIVSALETAPECGRWAERENEDNFIRLIIGRSEGAVGVYGELTERDRDLLQDRLHALIDAGEAPWRGVRGRLKVNGEADFDTFMILLRHNGGVDSFDIEISPRIYDFTQYFIDKIKAGDDGSQELLGRLTKMLKYLAGETRTLSDMDTFINMLDTGTDFGRREITGYVRGRVESFRDAAAAKGLSFTADMVSDKMAVDRCDLNLLGVAVDNLIQNAIKYTREGGITVRFSRKLMKVNMDDEGGREREYAVLEVEDTGIGVPEAEKHKIFGRGYRASNVGDIPGTGVGLGAVSYIVHVMGGDVHVKSQPGKGSTFTIRIPLSGEVGRRRPPAAVVTDDDVRRIVALTFSKAELKTMELTGAGKLAKYLGPHVRQAVSRSGYPADVFIDKLGRLELPEETIRFLLAPYTIEGKQAGTLETVNFEAEIFGDYLREKIEQIVAAKAPRRLKILLAGTMREEVLYVHDMVLDALKKAAARSGIEDAKMNGWIGSWDVQIVGYSIKADALDTIDRAVAAARPGRIRPGWIRLEYIDLLDGVQRERMHAERPDVVFCVSSLYIGELFSGGNEFPWIVSTLSYDAFSRDEVIFQLPASMSDLAVIGKINKFIKSVYGMLGEGGLFIIEQAEYRATRFDPFTTVAASEKRHGVSGVYYKGKSSAYPLSFLGGRGSTAPEKMLDAAWRAYYGKDTEKAGRMLYTALRVHSQAFPDSEPRFSASSAKLILRFYIDAGYAHRQEMEALMSLIGALEKTRDARAFLEGLSKLPELSAAEQIDIGSVKREADAASAINERAARRMASITDALKDTPAAAILESRHDIEELLLRDGALQSYFDEVDAWSDDEAVSRFFSLYGELSAIDYFTTSYTVNLLVQDITDIFAFTDGGRYPDGKRRMQLHGILSWAPFFIIYMQTKQHLPAVREEGDGHDEERKNLITVGKASYLFLRLLKIAWERHGRKEFASLGWGGSAADRIVWSGRSHIEDAVGKGAEKRAPAQLWTKFVEKRDLRRASEAAAGAAGAKEALSAPPQAAGVAPATVMPMGGTEPAAAPTGTVPITVDRFIGELVTRKSDGSSVVFNADYAIEEIFGLSPERPLKGKDVLVLGCGAGMYCFSAALEGAKKAVGVDLDENSIAIAKLLAPYIHDPLLRKRLTRLIPSIDLDDAIAVVESMSQGSEAGKRPVRVEPTNLDFIAADASNLSMLESDSFDAVAIPFLLAIENGILGKDPIRRVLEEALRVARPGATVYVAPSFPPEEWQYKPVKKIFLIGAGIEECRAMDCLVKTLSSLTKEGSGGKRLVMVPGGRGLYTVESIAAVQPQAVGVAPATVVPTGGTEPAAAANGAAPTGPAPTTESPATQKDRLSDTIEYIRSQRTGPTGAADKPLIIALGTSWIKGYEKGRYLQYDALNPLIGSIRTHCEERGIPFIVDSDDRLVERVNAEREKEGAARAKVVVLAGEEAVRSDGFETLRNDEEHAVVVGIDNSELTVDSCIRLPEMLTLALKLAAGLGEPQDSASIRVVRYGGLNIYIFIPHAEPMDYERLKTIYEVQQFA